MNGFLWMRQSHEKGKEKMAERQAYLWCKALQKRVRVVLIEKEDAPEEAWVPKGWGLRRCLDQGFACVGKECPFSFVARVPGPFIAP
ncbi:MAG: hypothetical protein HY211_01470 [Candidatus Omnitrophica bacterium]|nr:hypothetical protein [Candidatus Omnitrophota bacterium]